jgi:hypothetical protein
MYRQGLGDCFLLTFARPIGPYYMVIDCGVFTGTNEMKKRLTAVTQDIKITTDNHIHRLVITHEHYDHLSGFIHAYDLWKDIKIDEVWCSWVEKPGDQDGVALKQGITKRLDNLRRAMRAFPATTTELKGQKNKVKYLLDFHGDDTTDMGVASGPRSVRAALEWLKTRQNAAISYREPGEPPTQLPGTKARIFVLGPPRNETLLGRMNSTGAAGEVYGLGTRAQLSDSFVAALNPGSADIGERDIVNQCFPFDSYYRIDVEQVEQSEHASFFKRYYGSPTGSSQSGKEAWRRIDHDWLLAADQFALNLDNVVNNTSLAMAIELTETGKVLLFPGDAQVGNWQSWEEIKWELKMRDGSTRKVTGPDLLARTVFYKVGHHGSHNATLRNRGLEIMAANQDLVAMIPVDEAVVKDKGWQMPFGPILDKLKEKTEGRVLVAFAGHPPDSSVSSARREEFKQALSPENDLYIEYTLHG